MALSIGLGTFESIYDIQELEKQKRTTRWRTKNYNL